MDIKSLAIEIKQHLNKHLGNMVSDVVVFGSQVWGSAKSDSDYDVIIILNTSYNRKIQRKINDLCYELDLKYEIFLDTQIISEQEMRESIRGKHPVINIAMQKGIHA